MPLPIDLSTRRLLLVAAGLTLVVLTGRAVTAPRSRLAAPPDGLRIARGHFADGNALARRAEAGEDANAKSRDELAVQKMLDDQAQAWNRGDLKGFMAGYWESPELSFYSGRDKQAGWQATYDRYHKRYQADGREMGKLTFSELLFETLAADAILVRGRWKLDLAKESPDGLFTLVVRKKPDGWKIVHDHTSAGEPKKQGA